MRAGLAGNCCGKPVGAGMNVRVSLCLGRRLLVTFVFETDWIKWSFSCMMGTIKDNSDTRKPKAAQEAKARVSAKLNLGAPGVARTAQHRS